MHTVALPQLTFRDSPRAKFRLMVELQVVIWAQSWYVEHEADEKCGLSPLLGFECVSLTGDPDRSSLWSGCQQEVQDII
jgi:hypothetical protein